MPRKARWRTVKNIPIVGGTSDQRAELFFGVFVTPGGWADEWPTVEEMESATIRWADGSYATVVPEEETGHVLQCGGCAFVLALDGDWCLCTNAASPHDGRVTFEHGGCRQHSLMAEIEQEGEGE